MAKPKAEETEATTCSGGQSFGCRRQEHRKLDDVKCFRCGARMGCFSCCQKLTDLICLICHNWADQKGLKRHGNVIPNPKVPHVRIDSGTLPTWRHWHEGDPNPLSLVERFLEHGRSKT